jgi:hypothetical protein
MLSGAMEIIKRKGIVRFADQKQEAPPATGVFGR